MDGFLEEEEATGNFKLWNLRCTVHTPKHPLPLPLFPEALSAGICAIRYFHFQIEVYSPEFQFETCLVASNWLNKNKDIRKSYRFLYLTYITHFLYINY
jgi:hypothetical protein